MRVICQVENGTDLDVEFFRDNSVLCAAGENQVMFDQAIL
jgi:hypothetical protein